MVRHDGRGRRLLAASLAAAVTLGTAWVFAADTEIAGPPAYAVAWTADGEGLIVGRFDGTVAFYDASDATAAPKVVQEWRD